MSREKIDYVPRGQLSSKEAVKNADELAIVDSCFSRRTFMSDSEVLYSSNGKGILLRNTGNSDKFIFVVKANEYLGGKEEDSEDDFFLVNDGENIKPTLIDGKDLDGLLTKEMERRGFTKVETNPVL